MSAPIPLLPHQQAEINALRDAWIKVGVLFDKRGEHGHCETCDRCELDASTSEYGEGTATEVFDRCALGDVFIERPTDCPAYVEAVAEEAREAAWQAQGEAEMAASQ
jgi:hypothetical protein